MIKNVNQFICKVPVIVVSIN